MLFSDRVQIFALCKFITSLLLKFFYLLHKFLLIILKSNVLLDKPIQVLFELCGESVFAANHAVFFKLSNLTFQFGCNNLDLLFEFLMMRFQLHVLIFQDLKFVWKVALVGVQVCIGSGSLSFYFWVIMVVEVV